MAKGSAVSQSAAATSSSSQHDSILPLFPLLTSHDQPTRLDASVSLLTSLPLTAVNGASSTDVSYTIKRLVTGLGSANEAAREGFAVALAELIALLPFDSARTILPLVLDTTTAPGSADGKEERNLLFGRLFGLHALVRSNVLLHKEQPDSEQYKDTILALVALSGRKSWMREPASWAIVEAVRSLISATSAPVWKQEVSEWLVQRLINNPREKARGWTPEKVALVLIMQQSGIAVDYAAALAPTFPSGNILARSSLPALAQALKGSAGESSTTASAPKMGSNAVKTAKAGAPPPGGAPHFVWNEIFDLYFPANGAAPAKLPVDEPRAKWNDVWRILVDQSLFAPPSAALKSTGFALLSLALQRLPPAEIPALFGEGVVRTFTNNLRKSGENEKTLGRVADKLASSLPPYLAANPTVALPLLKALVAPPHGSHAFDHKTTEKLVAKLDLKGARGWVKYLKDFALTAGGTADSVSVNGLAPDADEAKAMNARRMWAFDQLLHVVKTSAVPKDDELIAELLEFFAVLGWFEVRKSGSKGARSYVPSPAATDSLRTAARSRFFSVLTALPLVPTAGETSSKASAAESASPSTSWLSRALALMENLENDTKHFGLAAIADDGPSSPEVVALRKSVKRMYTKLAGGGARERTARTLVEGVVLLSYDEGEESLEALEQITDCLPLLFPSAITSLSNGSAGQEQDDDDDEEGEEPEPTTVLVDMLLELLHRPSAFVKGIAQVVFTGFSDELGEQAMELLLEHIRPEVKAEDLDDEDQEDVEMADASAASNKGKGKEKKTLAPPKPAVDSSDDDDDDDEDDSDSEIDVDEDFKNELLKALQENGVAADMESDADGEETEEEYLDDDQMMALDDKLADIFRLQGGGRKGKKIDRTEDMHYRLRLVDLIEAFAKLRPSNPLLILVVIPLFGIVRSQVLLEEELQIKAAKTLRQIVQNKKTPVVPSSPESALEALAELHSISHSVDAIELSAICSQVAVFLTKAALASPGADDSTTETIANLFGDSFEAYLGKKNSKTKVQPLLTLDFCKRTPACAWPLFGRFVGLAASSDACANAFRRMQAFEAAHTVLAAYAAPRTPECKVAVLEAMPAYRDALRSVISSSATSSADTAPSSTDFDASRLKDIIKFALAAVRTTSNAANGDATRVRSLWRADEWVSLIDALSASSRFRGAQGLHNSIKQLVGLVGGATTAPTTAAFAATGSSKKDKKDRKRKVDDVKAEDAAVALSLATPASPSKKSKKNAAAAAAAAAKSAASEVEIEVDEDLDDGGVIGSGKGAEAALTKERRKEKKERKKANKGKTGPSAE